MHSNPKFRNWAQVGHRDCTPGTLMFYGDSSNILLSLQLTKSNGLYYCMNACYIPAANPSRVSIPRLLANWISMHLSDYVCLEMEADEGAILADLSPQHEIPRTKLKRKPTLLAKQLESELWDARLGFCGEWQLDVIPGKATGIPNTFDYHPLRFIDFKEQA